MQPFRQIIHLGNMNQKLNSLTLVLTLLSLTFSASSQSLVGVILDEETRGPLPFCTVGIAGKSSGTVANAEGKFILGKETYQPGDTLVVSHIGYDRYKKVIAEVPKEILLKPVSISLNEISILSRELTAKEIIEKIEENFDSNHPEINERQHIFLHEYEKAKFPNANQMKIKESDFLGLDPDVIRDALDKLPNEFVEYKDAIVEVYHYGNDSKLIPLDAVSLEEQSMQDLGEELENKFKEFGESIKESIKNEDQYFKIKTGILSFKADMDTANSDGTADTIYLNETSYLKSSINAYQKRYADISSDNWEFITKPGKYRYTKGEVTIVNDELVYQVSFKPKMGGLFEGVIYCSTATYGVLQVDFAYASGKSDENFHLLGIGHSIDGKGARVIWEHTKDGYLLKYINAYEHETASIDRNFSFVKKEKRFLWDKTVNTLSMDLNLYFDINDRVELLVMDRNPITEEQYTKAEEPKKITFRKEISNSPDIWNNQTVLAPTSELAKYKRSSSNK